MADHGTSWKRPLNGQTAVVSYRALVSVLLALIGGMLWAMWSDISTRQSSMGDKLEVIRSTVASDAATLLQDGRRLDQLEGDTRALGSRVNTLEINAQPHH